MLETATPPRSAGQQMDALALANRIRTTRACFKRSLKETADARAQAARAVDRPAPQLATMKVYELLKAVPRIGESKAQRIMFRHQVSPAKTLGGLSDRQRRALVAELEPADARAVSRSAAA